MWSMVGNSIQLFLRGRLFQEPGKVTRQVALGVGFTAILLVALAALEIPPWGAAILAGLFGGMLQPYLFKDLKYR